jgi:hypothetical protein
MKKLITASIIMSIIFLLFAIVSVIHISLTEFPLFVKNMIYIIAIVIAIISILIITLSVINLKRMNRD